MKRSSHFHFKQFSVAHDKTIHKVGTDGVLLGAWVNIANESGILDIGTGSGVISLIMAQRTSGHCRIDAIEIEKEAAAQATENVKKSPWPEKITVHHVSLQEFSTAKKYDLIVSNPPFFINSWLPPGKNRSLARHTHELSFEELIEAAIHLLSGAGRLAIVLPPQEAQQFTAIAKAHNLFVIRQCNFQSRKHKPIERLLIEFSLNDSKPVFESLILYSDSENWSDEYRKLTRDLYLKS